jgi:hypothetical protein
MPADSGRVVNTVVDANIDSPASGRLPILLDNVGIPVIEVMEDKPTTSSKLTALTDLDILFVKET